MEQVAGRAIPFSPNIYSLLILGLVRKLEPYMLKRILVASVFVALASTASEARPSRIIGQAPGCNVTMPCDFSISQTRRVTINSYDQGPQSVETPLCDAIPTIHAKWLKQTATPRRSPGRLPSFLLRLRGLNSSVRSYRAGVKSRGQLATVSANIASAGNGCSATRTCLRSGATCRRRYVDGL